MVLTDKQKGELHSAILEYLIESGQFPDTVAAMQREAGLSGAPAGGEASKGILEKKWTSVVRLQRKVMELEARIASGEGSGFSRGGAGEEGAGAAAGGSAAGRDGRLIPRPPARATLTGHRGTVSSVATHPVYSIVASASEDTTIKLWDFDSAHYERTLKGHTGAVTYVAFSPNGELLVSASADMSAKLWDMTSFACTKTLRGHDHSVSAAVFVNNEHVLTCSRDHTVRCWEVASGYCIRTYTGHSDWVRCLSVSRDGDIFASGSGDNSVIVWKFSTGQILQTLRGHEHVVESVSFQLKSRSDSTTAPDPDAPIYVVSGSRDRTVRLWDALKGTCVHVFTAHENWVRCVLLHPSGKFIISASDDKSIRVFDIKEYRCVRTIADAQSHFITSLSMSPKQPVLISASVDKAICVWDRN